MYVAVIFIFLAAAVALIFAGMQRHVRPLTVAGVFLILFTISGFWFMEFWGEMLWFDALGYARRFWLVALFQAGFALFGVLCGWIVVYLLTFTIPKERRGLRLGSKTVGAFVGFTWGLSHWDTLLRYLNRVSTGIKDPILGKDTGFYLFALPFYDALFDLSALLAIISLISVLISFFIRVDMEDIQSNPIRIPERRMSSGHGSLYASAAVFLFVLAWGKVLDRFHLMYSTAGVVTGAGWTDVHVRLPAYSIIALVMAALGVVLVVPALRRKIQRIFGKMQIMRENLSFLPLGLVGITVAVVWFLGLALIPSLFQWLSVEPNEITYEKPYISHNIRFTQLGFRLHEVEEREFPASARFTQQMVQKNPNLFSNIRLWDHRALDAVYKQFQEIRLYYEFEDVDVDRYTVDDTYRQVMVSARELELSNLPAESQTFVNRRFKYTHGYGITLTTVSEFTPQGLPNLLVKDIPPKSAYTDLEVTQPRLYYGELTRSHVVVNTQEEELDYPRGEENVYTHYSGSGGVELSHIGRKFLYGWKFDGTRFFLSGYPTSESRVMFHRQVKERVKTLAPFLHFDDDPYVVLVNGRLYWIIDAYTTSTDYPYSEAFGAEGMSNLGTKKRAYQLFRQVSRPLHGVNYVRNSVKAVVDAFNGSVHFYVFEPRDPLIRVWQKTFPNLFQPKEKMPEGLLNHIRYPTDMLLTQGLVYAKYHMTDPTVFYNQEDLWVRATEKYYQEVQPVEPYYIMWELPDSDELEFVLILPFTPKNRQVLIGWIAGMCDPENYGRLLAYKFPKEKRILGPQQVETKVDQDRFLSGQLTLWDQRGSNVIRGNVLAIPIEKTLLYVEPIYLQAETAAYPELRLVVVMHNDILSYAQTFDEALRGLFEKSEGKPEVFRKAPLETEIPLDDLIKKANQAFEDYLKHLGEKRFNEAAEALESLQKTLGQLSTKTGPGE